MVRAKGRGAAGVFLVVRNSAAVTEARSTIYKADVICIKQILSELRMHTQHPTSYHRHEEPPFGT